MSNSPSASASATVSFPLATITVVFLAVAKVQNLWGLGDLSWWWVFAPYWLSILIGFAIIALVLLIAFVAVSFEDRKRKRNRRPRY